MNQFKPIFIAKSLLDQSAAAPDRPREAMPAYSSTINRLDAGVEVFFPHRHRPVLCKAFAPCLAQQGRLGGGAVVVPMVHGIKKDVRFALHSRSFLNQRKQRLSISIIIYKVIIHVSRWFRKDFRRTAPFHGSAAQPKQETRPLPRRFPGQGPRCFFGARFLCFRRCREPFPAYRHFYELLSSRSP